MMFVRIRKHFYLRFFLIVFGCVIYACFNHNAGQEVQFKNLISLNVPTNINIDSLLAHAKHKVVIYVDSSDCEDCKISQALIIRGYDWELRQKQKAVPFIYIFNTQDIFSLQNYLAISGFRQYFFVDIEHTFLSDNRIPSDVRFHTFLLEDNKIKVIGNPSNSVMIRNQYNRALGIK